MSLVALIPLSLLITACCKPQVEYINVPYEVKVPTKCIVPDTECNFNKDTRTEVLNAMLECIVNQKRNSEVCK